MDCSFQELYLLYGILMFNWMNGVKYLKYEMTPTIKNDKEWHPNILFLVVLYNFFHEIM